MEGVGRQMDRIIQEDSERLIERLGAANGRFDGKRVLITGAGGFLGVHFLSYYLSLNRSGLLSRPSRVFAVDNFARGKPQWAEAIADDGSISLLQMDVTAPSFTPPVADFVIHAASIASPTYYRRHPLETIDANVNGLRTLLDAAVRTPPESFLFFSTSEIYGDPSPDAIPTPESYRGFVSCTGPRACYDESKRFGETLSTVFYQQHGIPVKTARPFNNYGPGLKISDRRVIPDFFRNVLGNEPILLLSDGSPTRTFCYVSDAIYGYLLVLLSGENGEPFNIGSDGPEISIKDLAKLVVGVSGRDVSVVCRPSDDPHYLSDNPQRRCPDISKARNRLGFATEYSLEDGLSRTFKWYLENPTAVDA